MSSSHEEDWMNRLTRREIDECLFSRELAEITFSHGDKRLAYVGGVFNEKLYLSHGIDEGGRLQPSIQLLPCELIKEYRTLNSN